MNLFKIKSAEIACMADFLEFVTDSVSVTLYLLIVNESFGIVTDNLTLI